MLSFIVTVQRSITSVALPETRQQMVVGHSYGRATHAPPQSPSQAARSLVQRPTAAYEVHDDHRDVGVADFAQP